MSRPRRTRWVVMVRDSLGITVGVAGAYYDHDRATAEVAWWADRGYRAQAWMLSDPAELRDWVVYRGQPS